MRFFTYTNINKFLSKGGKLLNKQYLSAFFLTLFTLLSGFMLSRHEMWRDEVEGYLMVQNLPLEEWRGYLRHSGHPGLFYLLLLPIRYLDLGLVSLKIFNFTVCLISVYLLLFKTKIPRGYLILFIFGSYMIYRFPSFSRNYGMGFLLLTWSSILIPSAEVKKRIWGYAFLILLPHTHILYVLASIPWGIYLLIRSFKSIYPKIEGILASLSLLASGFFLLYFVWPVQDSKFGESLIKDNHIAWELALPLTFFPGHFSSKFAYPLTWVLLASVLVWTKENLSILIYSLVGIVGFLFFFRFIYFAHMNHLSVFLVFILSILILIYSPKSGIKRKSAIAYTTLSLLVFSAFSQIRFLQKEDWKDISRPYSSAEMSALALKSCGFEPNLKLAAHPPDEAKTILGYLPKGTQFFFPALNRFGSYMNWDIALKKALDFKTMEVFEVVDKKPEIKFLILNTTETPSDVWELCPNPGSELSLVFNEIFYIYKRKIN